MSCVVYCVLLWSFFLLLLFFPMRRHTKNKIKLNHNSMPSGVKISKPILKGYPF